MTPQQIQNIFKQRYNQAKWKQFLGRTFANAQLTPTPQTLTGIDNHVASHAQNLGYILLDENGIERQIAVYEVTLAPGIILERNRVGLRNLLRKYWKNIDAAFIAYHRPESANWRFTYVSELTGYDAEGEFIKIKTEPKRYTYLLGEGESIRTAVERFERIVKKGSKATLDDVKEAFSVEKLSKTFFEEYKKHYDIFCKYMVSQPGIYQTIFNGDEKAIRDFNKKLLGRIVFLYFIQKKGWLGVPKNQSWGKGDFNFLTNHFQSFQHPELFYQDFLSVLFFDTLNTKRPDDLIKLGECEPCRIPYLNGGLFEEENKHHRNLIFTAKLFENLFNFFDQYNFTIYEDDPNDHTVAVDPEMLGHIFENLLEDNKDKGAYYTPKEIVHYMCQESLIEYLTTWFENQGYDIIGYARIGNPEQPELFPINEFRQGQLELQVVVRSESKQIDRILIEKLLKKTLDDNDQKLIKQYSAEFNQALDRVKICDPAIGSGAFPMGLLHEIFTAKQTLHTFEFGNTTNFDASGVKLNIIQNSIYGVDIERGAVDIARLRFWLSLIVDEPEPKALPNLDYKIVVGNSLVSKLDDKIIDIDWNIDQTAHGLFGHDLAKQQRLLLRKISQEQKEFFSPDSDKKKLSADIRNLKIDLLINQLELMVKTQGQETEPKAVNFKDKKKFVKTTELYYETIGWKNTITQLKKLKTKPESPLNFFDWKLDFPEVMNEQVVENVGFDIVIGNPPYIRIQELDKQLSTYFKNNYKTVFKNYDIYVLFVEKAVDNLIKLSGHICLINPTKFIKSDYGTKLKEFIYQKTLLEKFIDLTDMEVFDSVITYTGIFFLSKNKKSFFKYAKLESNQTSYLKNLSKVELDNISYDKISEKTWLLSSADLQLIFEKINHFTLLSKLSEIFVGLQTSADPVYILEIQGDKLYSKQTGKLYKFNYDIVKPLLKGAEIKRYSAPDVKYKIIFPYQVHNNSVSLLSEKELTSKYPLVWNYFLECEEKLKGRENGKMNIPQWWGYVYPKNLSCFSQPKIMNQVLANHSSLTLDINQEYYFVGGGTAGGYGITLKKDSELSYLYVLGLLNSTLLEKYLQSYSTPFKGGFFAYNKETMGKLPIPTSIETERKAIETFVDQILTLKSEGKDTTILEQQIDNLVYQLYELTYDEVKIIDPEFALTEQEYDAIKVE
jgi:adenine-specific DNA-methyltransferase